MSMDVIGAGFGRTGTFSLKTALEELGFTPCYHMREVFHNPDHAQVWERAARGDPPDWRAFLAPYRAAVDWPACYFWRDLVAAFPDAKVLLTERDPETWYRSISRTIFDYIQLTDQLVHEPGRGPQSRLSRLIVEERTFGGRLDHDHAIAVYQAHNAAVKEALGDKLLIYDVGQGWEPLCAFLGVAVPDAPFPKSNSTDEFRARLIDQ